MEKYIDADKMLVDESEAYLSAQSKITDKVTRDINFVVHTKLQNLLADAPAADVQEVQHGRWIAEDTDGSWSSAVCSVCGRRVGLAHYETDFAKHFPYCHCGAKMEGDDNDE